MDAEESTTRVTVAVYLDDDGEQKRFEVPGWVGIVAQLANHLTTVEGGVSAILGQIYIERPYSDPASAPDAMTVVDLRSNDGKDRMAQEFAGAIEDEDTLRRLMLRRLGAGAVLWTPVNRYVLNRTRPTSR